jgi:hypothetical protein
MKIDFTVQNEGSIFLLRPITPAGMEWVQEHIGSDNGFQPMRPTVVIDHRYIADVVEGIRGDGLLVR